MYLDLGPKLMSQQKVLIMQKRTLLSPAGVIDQDSAVTHFPYCWDRNQQNTPISTKETIPNASSRDAFQPLPIQPCDPSGMCKDLPRTTLHLELQHRRPCDLVAQVLRRARHAIDTWSGGRRVMERSREVLSIKTDIV